MGIAYATKLMKTRQGSKSPLRLQMTCSRIRKKLYLSKSGIVSLTEGFRLQAGMSIALPQADTDSRWCIYVLYHHLRLSFCLQRMNNYYNPLREKYIKIPGCSH